MKQLFSISRSLLVVALMAFCLAPDVALAQFQTFTTSGSFTVPNNVTSVTVEVWGGGGRGATMAATGAGGGGGGGAYSRSVLTVIPNTDYTVTVGAGSSSASPGGDTWFGSSATILAKGGSSAANDSAAPGVGGQASAGVGDVKFSGGSGAMGVGTDAGGGGSSAGSSAPGNSATGATGATAPNEGGYGGSGATGTSGPGIDGTIYGGAGGGAYRVAGATRVGGTGASGLVRVTWVGPEFNLYGNSLMIANGNMIPEASTGTHIGYTSLNVPISSQFFIENAGAGALDITSVVISGTNASEFSISAMPAASTPATGSTFLVIHFTPVSEGAKYAIVTIENNDSNEDPYVFAIGGVGTAADADGDGVAANEDCDDNDDQVWQYGDVYVDADQDGYSSGVSAQICYGAQVPAGYLLTLGALDCDDTKANVNPGAPEILYNGVDDNCDGNLDEGNELTTGLFPGYCGQTMGAINTILQAVSVKHATGYRFKIVNNTTLQEQVVEFYAPHFFLTWLASYEYDTTYTVYVEIQYQGIWLGYYGAGCEITTPQVGSPTGALQLIPSLCGSTLPTINSLISTTSLQSATGYRFEITNMTDPSVPNMVQTIDRSVHFFSLPMLSNYNYGTTYMVRVAVKTTDGYGAYGMPCTIQTPEVPTLANCGAQIPQANSLIYTSSLNKVTSYRFEVTEMSEDELPVMTSILNKPNHYFKFSDLTSYTPGAWYAVRVSLMTAGAYSPYGESCLIQAPFAARLNQQAAITEAPRDLKAVVFPNPYSETFSIQMDRVSEQPVTISVTDMLGRIVETRTLEANLVETATFGTTYPAGVYNIILTQDDQTRTLRVIKR